MKENRSDGKPMGRYEGDIGEGNTDKGQSRRIERNDGDLLQERNRAGRRARIEKKITDPFTDGQEIHYLQCIGEIPGTQLKNTEFTFVLHRSPHRVDDRLTRFFSYNTPIFLKNVLG
jgi:hypothetical protein